MEEADADCDQKTGKCKFQPNGMIASGGASKSSSRKSSIRSLDDLPMAPGITDNANNLNKPESSLKHRSNLSLDPSALVSNIRPPNRYISVTGDVDVNCNTGGSNSNVRGHLANQNQAHFDGYAGVNPVA